GGTSGIGEATSRRFIDEGARVIAFAYRSEEVSGAAQRIPGLIAAIRMDVADPEQVEGSFVEADGRFQRACGSPGVDVLINNAGMSIRHPFLEIEPADWRRVVDVNLAGVFH